MSSIEARDVLRIIREEAQVPSVSFTGGEPMLREDLLEIGPPLLTLQQARERLKRRSLLGQLIEHRRQLVHFPKTISFSFSRSSSERMSFALTHQGKTFPVQSKFRLKILRIWSAL
jgi:organic radical activating enzyme